MPTEREGDRPSGRSEITHPSPALAEFTAIADDLGARIASIMKRYHDLRDALAEAIAVFEGMADDEIELELLPRLRATLQRCPPWRPTE